MNSWRGWAVKNDFECPPRFPGCGTQHPHRALGGTRVLLAAAPTAPPCFRHWRRSSSLLGIFSGKIILISRLSRPAGRSKRIFTGGVVKADGIFVVYLASLSVKAGFRNARRRFFTKTKNGACSWSSCTSRFCFLCVGCGTKHSRCRAGSCRANRAAASRRKEKGMEEWSGALADAPFFWCNVVRIS